MSQLNQKQMKQLAVDVKAKIIWGHSTQDAVDFACAMGATREEAETMVKEATLNREREIRNIARRGLLPAAGLILLSAVATAAIWLFRIPMYGKFAMIYAVPGFSMVLGFYKAFNNLFSLITGKRNGSIGSAPE